MTAAVRTTLSWRRTGLSVVAAGLATARGIPSVDTVPGRPVLGGVAVALGLMSILVISRQAAVRARRLATDQPAAHVSDLLPVAASTALVALGAAIVVLVS